MVELLNGDNKGEYYCTCEVCGDNIRMCDDVIFFQIDAKYGQQMNKLEDGYESPGFCSRECAIAWMKGNIVGETVGVLADSLSSGGEE